MDTLDLVRANLLSPMVLAFVLGVVARLARSDLKLPEGIYAALSIYLLFAIGLKGGVSLSITPVGEVWLPAAAAVLFATIAPVWIYALVRGVARMSVADAAALAAHYGSVSVVTFTAAIAFLDILAVPYEGYMPALVALMEIPAIVVALMIARIQAPPVADRAPAPWHTVLHEVLAGRGSVLLIGGLSIGLLSGAGGFAQVAPFFDAPFKGVLVFFLLEMGMVAAGRLGDLRRAGAFLVAFGILLPVAHGTLGSALGWLIGLSPGGSTVLGVLAASASYIAAPVAVRIALPDANPGYYLTATLAITFPFNLAVGIPLYHAISGLIHAAW
jgi:uncharacterized protein